jgi:hypothetical protein
MMLFPPPMSGPDFWRASGFQLLEQGAGGMRVTGAFLAAWLGRPELRPPPEACAAERALHAALLDDPGQPVTEERLGALADPDARDNYREYLRLRDWLLARRTVEAAYLGLFREGAPRLAPLFVDQLAHVLVRAALDGRSDPFQARAGELLFRAQRITFRNGVPHAADAETVEMLAAAGRGRPAGLMAPAGTREVELDVLGRDDAWAYFERSDRFDTVLDLGFEGPGLGALCRVLEAWLRHLLGLDTRIEPLPAVQDQRWRWHVGLDAEASAILDDLYQGREVDEARRARLLSLFRLEIRDRDAVIEAMRGRPVYLGMATTENGLLRLKPQNLLVNLPLGEAA